MTETASQKQNPTSEEAKSEMSAMPLMEHLEELRSRLFKSVVVVAVLFIATMPFASEIIVYLKQPLEALIPNQNLNLHFTGPFDPFISTLKVSMLAAFIFGCPFWIYHLWKFVEPALYPNERKYVFPYAAASIFLFLLGVWFAYFIIIPMSLKFLLGLGTEIGVPIITVKDYLSLLIVMVFTFGLVFETPVILVLFGMLGLISSKTLSKQRGVVVVGVFVVAAILTPTPDPFTQTAMALPLYFMYELSILILKMLKK